MDCSSFPQETKLHEQPLSHQLQSCLEKNGVLSSQSSILIIQFRALSFRGKYPHDYISPRGDGVVPDSPCRPGAPASDAAMLICMFPVCTQCWGAKPNAKQPSSSPAGGDGDLEGETGTPLIRPRHALKVISSLAAATRAIPRSSPLAQARPGRRRNSKISQHAGPSRA